MGYDHQQSSSSGAIVAIVVAVLLVGIIGIIAVAGAGLLLVGTSSRPSRALAIEHRMATEVHRTKAEEKRAIVELQRGESVPQRAVFHVQTKDGRVQVQESGVAAMPDPRLNFEVTLDREGNVSIDGKGIGLDELRAQLVKLKDETSNAFSVHINTDAECSVKLLIPVLDVCEEVGDIDFRIASSQDAASVSEAE